MKNLKTILLFVLAITFSFQINAQTVDEIIETYFENTGGVENWQKLEGIKTTASVNQGGMEIPLEIYQLKDGRQMTVVTFQGKIIKQNVFDGEVLWSTNFMTQKAEKSDAEITEIVKTQTADFPDPFLNYKDKGYKAELLGNEEIDGANTFKIKLTRKPIVVDGQEVENIAFYYFDADNFVPIVVHSEIKSGPMAGQMSETKMSDYQEVEGLYFPFSVSQGIKGQGSQSITFSKIEFNPTVDANEFKFPEEKEGSEEQNKN